MQSSAMSLLETLHTTFQVNPHVIKPHQASIRFNFFAMDSECCSYFHSIFYDHKINGWDYTEIKIIGWEHRL